MKFSYNDGAGNNRYYHGFRPYRPSREMDGHLVVAVQSEDSTKLWEIQDAKSYPDLLRYLADSQTIVTAVGAFAPYPMSALAGV